jgi:hypothetical protein
MKSEIRSPKAETPKAFGAQPEIRMRKDGWRVGAWEAFVICHVLFLIGKAFGVWFHP